ncbi:hypothetical protein Tco_0557873, partial [Tanacetum coccineum]
MTHPSTTYQSAPVMQPPSAYTPTTNTPPTYHEFSGESFEDAIHNLENEFNGESGGDNLGELYFSLSDDEENVVQ